MPDREIIDRQALRVQAHIAEATLPDAGAYTSDSADFLTLPGGSDYLGIVVQYTAAEADGNWQLLLEWQSELTGTNTIRQLFLDNHEGELKVVQAPIPGPGYDDTAEHFDTLDMRIPSGATAVRVRIAETGQEESPGDAAVYLAVRKD